MIFPTVRCACLLVFLIGVVSVQTRLQAQGPTLQPTVLYRIPEWRDRNLVAAKRGRVEVAVREVEAPVRPIAGARVRVLKLAGQVDSSLVEQLTSASGVVFSDSVPTGPVVLRVRAIGYAVVNLHINLLPGCVTHVEVYLQVVPLCEVDCPARMLPRATVTTCRPDA
jgi:hypothetical protein